ncbi:MAG: hypothetical protein UW39_C0015G0009 [Parcubacteria group bacterium GW2011_GWC2_44_17]|uniref:Toxin YoeB n=1 Tax=Candidatus Jacksonbacteria bacterium RIFCSPLOWO2_02_FULL_44_20 TaxID=1798460 RepID=A0A1G2A883_9BACT|nr:MAG: hypothetical protein UW39_C0015G0009 [Parcubacteria group bacterium GW2011_GWC2_44_17]KKT50638.1 MAG: hypothetical protein UW40_C0001G0013 [Parcubacteria group bacterium GW2011_GWF2_44_17]OGY71822.1 MAG: hypothetical protein A3C00_01360 [Candidatus Jacksonbacteria bacterium RIFCSPHIGHO2_02_FULL_44_25]OGY71944.1 MAG: hypothetical protein A3E05_01675 [Candidatus Jacksonbacteria bacterium RIFCSPHIGHO2_12_FULL_44_12]OGY72863.1 MAG: hypothetical protein A3H07_02740 [Candidatus Jacksonbacteri
MYTLSPTRRYVDAAKKFNEKTKEKLKAQHELLAENPFHPSLRTKPLKGKLRGIFSFRIGRDRRGLFAINTQDKIIELLRLDWRSRIYQ